MYLAAYIDFYSRKVVGWAFDTHMRSELIETALKRSLWNRKPPKVLTLQRVNFKDGIKQQKEETKQNVQSKDAA